ERKSHSVGYDAPILVLTRVGSRQERCHRIRVGEVQLNTVEASLAGAQRRPRKQRWQLLREVANVVQMCISHTLARAELERIELAGLDHLRRLLWRQRQQPLAHFGIRCMRISQRQAVPRSDRQEFAEKPRAHRPPPDGQKIDELDEEPRFSATGFPYHPSELA